MEPALRLQSDASSRPAARRQAQRCSQVPPRRCRSATWRPLPRSSSRHRTHQRRGIPVVGRLTDDVCKRASALNSTGTMSSCNLPIDGLSRGAKGHVKSSSANFLSPRGRHPEIPEICNSAGFKPHTDATALVGAEFKIVDDECRLRLGVEIKFSLLAGHHDFHGDPPA